MRHRRSGVEYVSACGSCLHPSVLHSTPVCFSLCARALGCTAIYTYTHTLIHWPVSGLQHKPLRDEMSQHYWKHQHDKIIFYSNYPCPYWFLILLEWYLYISGETMNGLMIIAGTCYCLWSEMDTEDHGIKKYVGLCVLIFFCMLILNLNSCVF